MIFQRCQQCEKQCACVLWHACLWCRWPCSCNCQIVTTVAVCLSSLNWYKCLWIYNRCIMSVVHINLHFYAYMTSLLNWIIYLCLLLDSPVGILLTSVMTVLSSCSEVSNCPESGATLLGDWFATFHGTMLLTSSRVRCAEDETTMLSWHEKSGTQSPSDVAPYSGKWRPWMWRSHENLLWQQASRVVAQYSWIRNNKRAAAPKCFSWWDVLLRYVIVLFPCLLCLWCKLAVSIVREVWESVGTVK